MSSLRMLYLSENKPGFPQAVIISNEAKDYTDHSPNFGLGSIPISYKDARGDLRCPPLAYHQLLRMRNGHQFEGLAMETQPQSQSGKCNFRNSNNKTIHLRPSELLRQKLEGTTFETLSERSKKPIRKTRAARNITSSWLYPTKSILILDSSTDDEVDESI